MGGLNALTCPAGKGYKLATMTHAPDTIRGLLSRGAADQDAIRAPARVPLSHGELQAWLQRSSGELASHGVSRGATIADR